MSGSGMRRGPAIDPHTTLQEPHHYTPTLLEVAERLAIEMGSKLPDDGLQIGVLHQLEGRKLHGASCTSILVFEGSHAVFLDYSTGIQVTVDSLGKRRTAMLGASR